MHCKLCGHEFNATNMACHTECPLGSRCSLICCPNCGYQVVDESKSWLAQLLHRLWPSAAEEPALQPQRVKDVQTGQTTIPLTHVPIGKAVEVHGFGHISAGRLTQLCIFGLIPGETIEVLQRRPSPVVRIGQTELALGEEILEQIWVQA